MKKLKVIKVSGTVILFVFFIFLTQITAMGLDLNWEQSWYNRLHSPGYPSKSLSEILKEYPCHVTVNVDNTFPANEKAYILNFHDKLCSVLRYLTGYDSHYSFVMSYDPNGHRSWNSNITHLLADEMPTQDPCFKGWYTIELAHEFTRYKGIPRNNGEYSNELRENEMLSQTLTSVVAYYYGKSLGFNKEEIAFSGGQLYPMFFNSIDKVIKSLNTYTIYQTDVNFDMNSFTINSTIHQFLSLFLMDPEFFKNLLGRAKSWNNLQEYKKAIVNSVTTVPQDEVEKYVDSFPYFKQIENWSNRPKRVLDIVLMSSKDVPEENKFTTSNERFAISRPDFCIVTGQSYTGNQGVPPWEIKPDMSFFDNPANIEIVDEKGSIVYKTIQSKIETNLANGGTYLKYNFKNGDIYTVKAQAIIDDIPYNDNISFIYGTYLEAYPMFGGAPLNVQLKVVSPVNFDCYSWDFDGDGIIDRETKNNTVSYTYFEPGIYHPSVIIHKSNGKTFKLSLSLIGVTYRNIPFSDLTNDYSWAYDSILSLYTHHITTGYPDGTFKPGNYVTRAQMAAFIARAMKLDIPDKCVNPPFNDVATNEWFCPYIEVIKDAGVTQGTSNGYYDPEGYVTRAQMAAFLSKALDLDTHPCTVKPFIDVPLDDWYCPYVQAIKDAHLTTGYSDGTYSPYNYVTRAEMAVFLERAFLNEGLINNGNLYDNSTQQTNNNNGSQSQNNQLNPYDNNTSLKYKWKFNTDGSITTSPAISQDGTLYFGVGNNLFSLNRNGTLKWERNLGSPIHSYPTISSDGTIYVGSWSGYIYAINSDGTEKWRFWTGGWIDSSPAIDDNGTIYIGSSNKYFYAVNKNGSLKWKIETDGWVDSSPAIGVDGTIYAGSKDGHLYAFDPEGYIKWKFSAGSPILSSPALSSDGAIYIGSEDGYLYAVNKNGSLEWKFKVGSPIYSSPIIYSDGTIYVCSSNGSIYSIDQDGYLKWVFNTNYSIDSTPAIDSEGTLFVGTDNGYLYAINYDGKLKWKFYLGGSVKSSPSIDINGNIFTGSYSLYDIDSSYPLANSSWPMFQKDVMHTGQQ